MTKQNLLQREHQLEDILFSDLDSAKKSQKIIKLGFEETAANEIIKHHQRGSRGPVYYERLDFADLKDDETNPDNLAIRF